MSTETIRGHATSAHRCAKVALVLVLSSALPFSAACKTEKPPKRVPASRPTLASAGRGRRAEATAKRLAAAPAPTARDERIEWRRLQAGVEYVALPVGAGFPLKERKLHLVRIDPRRATLFAGLASQNKGRSLTAREWARRFGLTAVINLGMFQTDHVRNVGYLRVGSHRNNPSWHKKYFSVLAFDPKRPDLATAQIIDVSAHAPALLGSYRVVVQNLRLIKEVSGRGENVWSNQARRWSEAALAADRVGRLLFIFSRAPFRMVRFNRLLLSLPLDIVRAMHLEGGPEASLSVHGDGVDLDLAGSFESQFLESDRNREQWPLPNVLGVKR